MLTRSVRPVQVSRSERTWFHNVHALLSKISDHHSVSGTDTWFFTQDDRNAPNTYTMEPMGKCHDVK